VTDEAHHVGPEWFIIEFHQNAILPSGSASFGRSARKHPVCILQKEIQDFLEIASYSRLIWDYVQLRTDGIFIAFIRSSPMYARERDPTIEKSFV